MAKSLPTTDVEPHRHESCLQQLPPARTVVAVEAALQHYEKGEAAQEARRLQVGDKVEVQEETSRPPPTQTHHLRPWEVAVALGSAVQPALPDPPLPEYPLDRKSDRTEPCNRRRVTMMPHQSHQTGRHHLQRVGEVVAGTEEVVVPSLVGVVEEVQILPFVVGEEELAMTGPCPSAAGLRIPSVVVVAVADLVMA